jgi:hypothetical protein
MAGFYQMLGLAAVQADGFDVLLQIFLTQLQYSGGGIGYGKEFFGRFIHADIGRLRTQNHRTQQFKDAGVFQFSDWQGVGGLQGGEKSGDLGFGHAPILEIDRGQRRHRVIPKICGFFCG